MALVWVWCHSHTISLKAHIYTHVINTSYMHTIRIHRRYWGSQRERCMVMRRLPHPVSRCEDTRVILAMRWWRKNLAARIVCVCVYTAIISLHPSLTLLKNYSSPIKTHIHSHSLTHPGGGGCAINNFRTHLYTCPFFRKSSSCARERALKRKHTREPQAECNIWSMSRAVSVSLSLWSSHRAPTRRQRGVRVCAKRRCKN